jgi:1,4-dihydroxy-2-naphthoate octaprenyltransferase
MRVQQAVSRTLPLWVVKLRAGFFTADVVPVCLGAAVAWARAGSFNLAYFLLTLLALVCVNAGTNMTNDYFDHTWGSDEINKEFVSPFTGGSRLIQLGLVKPETFLWQGIGFFVLATLIGVVLALTRGLGVLWLGIIGVFSGFFYTAPPVRLVRSGMGELLVGLNLGPLAVLGSAYVQTRRVWWEPVVASLPVMFLIALVLWINEFQDLKADAAVGKRHVVARLGRRRAARIYVTMLALTYISVVAGVLLAGVTPFALLTLLTVPVAWKAGRTALVFYDRPRELTPANAATVLLHLEVGLLLAVGYLLQGLVNRPL